MNIVVSLQIDGSFISETSRTITRVTSGGTDIILKPDILTLQTRSEGGEHGSVSCRVINVESSGEDVKPTKESPESYVSRMFFAYCKYYKRITKDPVKDHNTLRILEDITRKINKVCVDKHIPNPLRGVT